MSEIYLVGGTTPRTDLDNYVSANISKDNAISSMNKWQEYQEDYEDFHIDSIEIDDLEQHDKEIIQDYIDKVVQKLEDLRDELLTDWCCLSVHQIEKAINIVKESI